MKSTLIMPAPKAPLEFLSSHRKPVATRLPRAVIYARYSSDMQDDTSIDVQVTECSKYAQKNNMVVTREPYVDAALSGTSTQHRVSYQRLLSDAFSKEKDFDYIIVFHTSRWGRGMDSEVDEFLLEKKGIRVVSTSQAMGVDDSPETFLIRGIIRKVDAYYSLQLSRYTHVYQTNNARNGFINGGRVPDGYVAKRTPTGKTDRRGNERAKVQFELNLAPGPFDLTTEPRWKLVAYYFEAAFEGKGLRTIAKEVFALGWRLNSGSKPIGTSHIRAALLNPIYTGHVVWNRKKWKRIDGRRRCTENDPIKWVFSDDASHDPIVSREKFEEVMKRFMRNPRGRFMGHQLLSGLIICANCGSAYTLSSGRKKDGKNYEYYICNKKHRTGWQQCNSPMIQKAAVEEAVEEIFLTRILTEDEVRQFVELFNEWVDDEKDGNSPELKQITEKIKTLETELTNLKNAVATGQIDLKHLAGQIEERDKLRSALIERRSMLSAPIQQEKLRFDETTVQRYIESMRNLYRQMDLESKREMLRHYIKKIEIHADKKGRIVYDPASLLSFRDRPPNAQIPSEEEFCPKNGCGGRI